MKMYHYGKWTVYVIITPTDFAHKIVEGHMEEVNLPHNTMSFMYFTNSMQSQSFMTNWAAEKDADLRIKSRYTLLDAIKMLGLKS